MIEDRNGDIFAQIGTSALLVLSETAFADCRAEHRYSIVKISNPLQVVVDRG